jgi:hypothetical protein
MQPTGISWPFIENLSATLDASRRLMAGVMRTPLMRSLDENKDLFELLASDGQTWLAQANQLKMAADSILPNVVEAFKIPPALPGAQEKRFAFFHSYMLLTGMAFENLIKGILIQRDKKLVTREQIEGGILPRGGHGITAGAKNILTLTAAESNLLQRIEEYLFWAGRYPVPLKSGAYHNSEVQELRSGRSDDPPLVDSLFQRLTEILRPECPALIRSSSA